MDTFVEHQGRDPAGRLRHHLLQLARHLIQLQDFIMQTSAQETSLLTSMVGAVGGISNAVDALIAAQGQAGSTTPEEDAATQSLQDALATLAAKVPPAALAAAIDAKPKGARPGDGALT